MLSEEQWVFAAAVVASAAGTLLLALTVLWHVNKGQLGHTRGGRRLGCEGGRGRLGYCPRAAAGSPLGPVLWGHSHR